MPTVTYNDMHGRGWTVAGNLTLDQDAIATAPCRLIGVLVSPGSDPSGVLQIHDSADPDVTANVILNLRVIQNAGHTYIHFGPNGITIDNAISGETTLDVNYAVIYAQD